MSTSTASPTPTPITSVLVANRGEIARRVIRTARAMGIRTVAVFVEADAGAPYVTEADGALRIATRYLDGEAILAAAQESGADAIHPGYGFLSENAAFARSVIDAGLAWVGPSPDVIDAMGDKITAKQAAVEAGVPTLPSTEDPASAGEVGYPLLVKASAGGGGKGMRIVERAEDLDESLAAAQREALSGFGDDRVFLERYVPRSRHVEIQILGDQHGTVIHLGERECSIQRRHQKVIEESPSSVVDEAMRAAMGDAALGLARAIGYTSTGTVEFLVDDGTREFFFLEVNTRLQVEHPVTEEVTGIDLVREQFRVASGEPLEPATAAATFTGHAVEARLYAEDPAAGFLPATGTVEAFAPAADAAVRWDSGVEPGSVVGVDFDPMLAKVVAHAPTRTEAALRLALALERLHVGGVTTNRDFLVATLRAPEFLAGDTTTDFIERVGVPLAREASPSSTPASPPPLHSGSRAGPGQRRRCCAPFPAAGATRACRRRPPPSWSTAPPWRSPTGASATAPSSSTAVRLRLVSMRGRHRRSTSRTAATGSSSASPQPAPTSTSRSRAAPSTSRWCPASRSPAPPRSPAASSPPCPGWSSMCGSSPASTSPRARPSSCSRP
ncbi:biotin carboxylase N-terminal domain-containing protein [Aquihabitans daechungensis]|uniref:acetyl-CoA carboxylase biotin carboxylase subunit n=1 Tax=Aquihabitans daechungensis TaxID=1052257 RepID=UPI003BA2EEDB